MRRVGTAVLVGLLGFVVGLTIGFLVGRLFRLIDPAWLEAVTTGFGGLVIAIAVIVVAVALFSIPNAIGHWVRRLFTSGARARLRWCLYGLSVIASFALIFIIPLLESDESTSAKVVDGLGTGVVVLGLTVALATYLSNSRNKRIEQVYAFHKELAVGEIGAARRRLSRLVYSQQRNVVPRLREISRSEVKKGGKLAGYDGDDENNPDEDWTLVIRFFERVWYAQRQGSFDDLTVASTIGRAACWWDLALNTVEDQDKAQRALSEFAQWANRYQEEHPDEPRLTDWGGQRKKEFGRSKRDPLPTLGGVRRLSWFRRDITE